MHPSGPPGGFTEGGEQDRYSQSVSITVEGSQQLYGDSREPVMFPGDLDCYRGSMERKRAGVPPEKRNEFAKQGKGTPGRGPSQDHSQEAEMLRE